MQVENDEPQSAPELSLSCSWNDAAVIAKVIMDHDTCTAPPGIFAAQIGEAAALFIRADTFSTRNIFQSSARLSKKSQRIPKFITAHDCNADF